MCIPAHETYSYIFNCFFFSACISSRALAIRPRATHLAWFWASLLLLSCGLRTSCPSRQRCSGWALLVPAGWSRWACTAACWALLGGGTELFYRKVTPSSQNHSVHFLLTDTLVQCKGNIAPSCCALQSLHCSHLFVLHLSPTAHTDVCKDSWTCSSSFFCVSRKLAWVFSGVLGTFSFHLFLFLFQTQAIFYKVVLGLFFRVQI